MSDAKLPKRGGPRTVGGKLRSSRNALKHGLRARRLVLLDDEDPRAFKALEAGVRAELAPAGALEAELVGRIVAAAWRARRADRLEAALLGRHLDIDPADPQAALGTGLVRDGHGPRVLETLVRYRGSVLAELFRALGALERVRTGPDPDRPRSVALAPVTPESRGPIAAT